MNNLNGFTLFLTQVMATAFPLITIVCGIAGLYALGGFVKGVYADIRVRQR